jgi:Flp pilus assembly protein TadD
MRRVAWMLVLIGLAGCGKTAPTTTAISNTTSREIVIPKDIQELLQRREFSQAISTITGLIEKQPRDEQLYTIRSMVLHQSGRFN